MYARVLSRSPPTPWVCFCRLCFSWSAPVTLFEGLLWVTGAGLPGSLRGLGTQVVWAYESPVLLPQVGTNSEVSWTQQSSIWDQTEAGTFPEIATGSTSFSSLFCFPPSLTSFFWEHFLRNVLHVPWIAHKSSSQGLLLARVCIKRRWCWVGMGVGKNISSGARQTWDLLEFLCYHLFVGKPSPIFLNSLTLSLLICKTGRIWPPRELVVRLDLSSAQFLAHCEDSIHFSSYYYLGLKRVRLEAKSSSRNELPNKRNVEPLRKYPMLLCALNSSFVCVSSPSKSLGRHSAGGVNIVGTPPRSTESFFFFLFTVSMVSNLWLFCAFASDRRYQWLLCRRLPGQPLELLCSASRTALN